MFPVRTFETVYQRGYVFHTPVGELTVKTEQLAGETCCRLIAELERAEGFTLCFGTEKQFGQRVLFADGVATAEGLPARGGDCYVRVERDGEPITGTLRIRMIHRYPYGRTFEDYRERMVQHFGQSSIIGYDVVNNTTSEPLEPYMRALEGTNPAMYLDHIIATIIDDSMTEMEKAKAIWLFIGPAIQHNAIHMNLRETVPAMTKFYEDPTCDLDDITVYLLELGFTRCGVINGFMSGALLKRVGIRNEVISACGGHTGAKAFIDGAWRVWDVDAYKGVIPLDDDGNIPPLDWVRCKENSYLLDTVPSWADNPAEDGWLTAHDGHRISGYIDGGRYHSETGYAASWWGQKKSYPPSVPELLPVRYRQGETVLLEWIGSYDRDGDFKDYRVLVTDENGSLVKEIVTEKTYAEVSLPVVEGYRFTVQARDHYADGTKYEGKIDYSFRKPISIPAHDVSETLPWDLIADTERENRADMMEKGFTCIEGSDNVIGETKIAQSQLFTMKAAKTEKQLAKMVDESSSTMAGSSIRTLYACRLPEEKTNAQGWHMTAVLRITPYDFAGESKFPLLWIGKRGSHIGAGIGLKCKEGLVYASCNIMGDWRYSGGFDPKGYVRIDVICEPGVKRIHFYADGEEIAVNDYSMFHEGVFDVDTVYISGNPNAETGYLVFDVLV